MAPSTCVLGRVFTSGSQEISLGYIAAPPLKTYQLILAVPMTVFPGPGTATVTVPGAPPFKAPLGFSGFVKPGVKQVSIPIDRANVPAVLAAKEVSLQSQGQTLVFQTGGSEGAVKAMASCETSLLQDWKIAQAEIDGAAKPATPLQAATWFKQSDYPKEAREAKKQGNVGILYRIDAAGKIDDCRVIESSGVPALDDASCAVLRQRAHYQPAHDASGNAVAAWDRLNVPWTLPK